MTITMTNTMTKNGMACEHECETVEISDSREYEFMKIIVTRQLRVTLDSIHFLFCLIVLCVRRENCFSDNDCQPNFLQSLSFYPRSNASDDEKKVILPKYSCSDDSRLPYSTDSYFLLVIFVFVFHYKYQSYKYMKKKIH